MLNENNEEPNGKTGVADSHRRSPGNNDIEQNSKTSTESERGAVLYCMSESCKLKSFIRSKGFDY